MKMIKKIILSTLFISLFGCGGSGGSGGDDTAPTPTPTYTVTVSANIDGAGLWGGGDYQSGEYATVSASAPYGYIFEEWVDRASPDKAISTDVDYQFEVLNDTDLIAKFDVDPLAGAEKDFTYNWDMSTKKVTVTNNNSNSKLFLWGTSSPVEGNYNYAVTPANIWLDVGETVEIDAVQPLYSGWKPDLIFSTENGSSYEYHAPQSGSAFSSTLEIMIIDFAETLTEQYIEYAEAFEIADGYGVVGDGCYDFSWLDKNNGWFEIRESSTGLEAHCYAGNEEGYDKNGNRINLPPVRYYVTNKSEFDKEK